MIKKFLKTIKYYFNKNLWLIYFLGAFFSLIGSYQYYNGKFENSFKLFSVVMISVAKLYLFNPLDGFTKNYPILLEFALWLAPIGTVLATFSIFNKLFTSIFLRIKQFNRERIIIMGYNEYSLTFMKNFVKSKDKRRLLCILSENIDENDLEYLNKRGILTCFIDYSSGISQENIRTAREFEFSRVNTIISFEEEPNSYGYLEMLSNLIKIERNPKNTELIDVHFNIKNKRIRDIAQYQMDKFTIFDIRYFNVYDLIAQNLISDDEFSFFATKGFTKTWSNKNISSMKEISQIIGNTHLLLIGFSDLGKWILELAANQSTINIYKNIKITIVDEKANDLIEEYRATIRNLDKVMDINIINGNFMKKCIQDKIKKLHKDEPFTSVIIATKDILNNLTFLDLFSNEFKNLYVGLYCRNLREIKPLVEAIKIKYTKLKIFGQLSKLLDKNTIINEKLDSGAKKFNAYYNKVISEFLGYEIFKATVDEQWNVLSSIKKDSSRNQFLHQNVKKYFLKKITEMPNYPNEISDLIKMWKTKLEGLTITEKVDLIEKDVVMNYLMALEHKRWNNFYYMRDFVFSDIKDEINRTHDCLIDDWSEFMSGKQRDKAIYDFLSVLSIE